MVSIGLSRQKQNLIFIHVPVAGTMFSVSKGSADSLVKVNGVFSTTVADAAGADAANADENETSVASASVIKEIKVLLP